MKKVLLLFAMFAFIGTAYTATASTNGLTGIYCDGCKGGNHKCDDNCKKECKKSKSCKKGTKSSAKKKGCCSKGGASAAKSCHSKNGAKTSSANKANAEEKK